MKILKQVQDDDLAWGRYFAKGGEDIKDQGNDILGDDIHSQGDDALRKGIALMCGRQGMTMP